MSKVFLILAALVGAWALWVEYGDRLEGGVAYRPAGDGRDTPAAAGIVGSGAGEAARGIDP